MDSFIQLQDNFKGIAKKNIVFFSLILSLGILLHGCDEQQNPVSDISSPESIQTPITANTGVNTDPIKISGFDIVYNSRVYDGSQTTFNYTVTRGDNATGFNYLFFETPSCAINELTGFTPDNGVPNSTVEGSTGIKWTSSIGSGSSQDYSVSYNGEQPLGMVNATIQANGSGDIETKVIPGPCKGIYTISGFIYVDEDSSKTKNTGEGGIGNITVHLAKNNNESTTLTSADGSYTFSVYTGDSSSDFSIEVRSTSSTSNTTLLDNFTPIPNPPKLNVTVSNKNVNGQNLGFNADVERIIQKFNSEEIRLKTETPAFWANEFKFYDKGKKTFFTRTELLSFLDLIESLDLTYNFTFGSIDDDRISKALDILTIRKRSTELEIFLSELLAAKLNVVSGNGAVDESGAALNDFNDLILKTGAAAAVDLSDLNGSLIMNSTTYETTTFTNTSNLISSRNLLTSFNGSGGGIGD